MIKAFLFDLDGVLTDTSEVHYKAWQRLADEEGLPFDRQDNEALRGISRRESLDLLLKGKEISEETAQTWMDRKNRYYVELINQIGPEAVLPGVVDLLKEIRASGIKSVVASASKNAPTVLDLIKLRPLVDGVVDGNTVSSSKPAPDLFLAAARLVGMPPADCVVVEDAAVGIEAGQAAGMYTLGLGPPDRVGQADLVLPDLAGVHLEMVLASLASVPIRHRS